MSIILRQLPSVTDISLNFAMFHKPMITASWFLLRSKYSDRNLVLHILNSELANIQQEVGLNMQGKVALTVSQFCFSHTSLLNILKLKFQDGHKKPLICASDFFKAQGITGLVFAHLNSAERKGSRLYCRTSYTFDRFKFSRGCFSVVNRSSQLGSE